AGILAGVPMAAPRTAANAAECLTEPGKGGTRSQHWYYRIEHGTKRHCWYLRGEDETVSQSEPSDESAQPPKATPQNNESPPRASEAARAEYPMPQARGNAIAAPAPAPLASNPVPPTVQPDAQGSAVAARWPSPETATSPSAAAAAAAPQAAADTTDSQPAA